MNKYTIVSVSLRLGNPSMGPHEKKISYLLRNDPGYEKGLEDFMNKSILFNKYTLEEYVRAVVDHDEAVLNDIKKLSDSMDGRFLNDGATIKKLELITGTGQEIYLRDLRTYEWNDHFYSFLEYIKENGKRFEEPVL